ncbi:phospholipase D-like domain-containing protein [Sorangium sp. So ce327]|jgi:cardiolipin synthase|uniref:phospholipase D-like domain-containing protein n=1 Tax=unclassified Sorangium TaxID=2621164 RepID=UPI003F609387
MSQPPPAPAFAEMTVGAHRLALLKDGAQTYPAMLEAIARARRTICLETYILRVDRTGQRFAEALMERAAAGVEVNVLFDAWGSSVSSSFLDGLHRAGVRSLAFRPLDLSAPLGKVARRDHRKALIVDGAIAFTGGLNLSDDYAAPEDGGADWRDTHLRIEGPAAAELQYFFLRTWQRTGGAPIDDERYGYAERRPDPAVQIISNDLPRRRHRHGIRDAYRHAIERARRRIYITNAYFLPPLRIIHVLSAAARRGVDVRIMVAGTTDVPAVLLASRAIYGHLLDAGARMFEWRGRVLHAKTAVIDGLWSTVGSTNLDSQSLRMNLEVNAVVSHRGFAGAMERMFADDLSYCREITAAGWAQRPLWERAASWTAYLARDWL